MWCLIMVSKTVIFTHCQHCGKEIPEIEQCEQRRYHNDCAREIRLLRARHTRRIKLGLELHKCGLCNNMTYNKFCSNQCRDDFYTLKARNKAIANFKRRLLKCQKDKYAICRRHGI